MFGVHVKCQSFVQLTERSVCMSSVFDRTFYVHVESRGAVSVACLLSQLTERSVCMSSVTILSAKLVVVGFSTPTLWAAWCSRER